MSQSIYRSSHTEDEINNALSFAMNPKICIIKFMPLNGDEPEGVYVGAIGTYIIWGRMNLQSSSYYDSITSRVFDSSHPYLISCDATLRVVNGG